MPLDELIRFWATGCDADVQRIPESAVELGYGVGDVLPFLRTPEAEPSAYCSHCVVSP